MKNNLLSIVFLLTVLSCLTSCIQSSQGFARAPRPTNIPSNRFSIDYKLSKNQYLLGEPIYITIDMLDQLNPNQSFDDFSVTGSYDIWSKDGRGLANRWNSVAHFNFSGRTNLTLARRNWMTYKDKVIHGIPAGKWFVTAKFELFDKKQKQRYRVKKTIPFRIVEPSGNDLEIFMEYAELFLDKHYNHSVPKDYKKRAEILVDELLKNKQSGYIDWVGHNMVLSQENWGNVSKFLELCEYLLMHVTTCWNQRTEELMQRYAYFLSKVENPENQQLFFLKELYKNPIFSVNRKSIEDILNEYMQQL